MARYRGPVEKIERRLDADLGLKGERRLSGKSALEKRPFAPGQHGQRRAKISEYGLQLREKQKAKFMYGVSEKQFRKYFQEAARREGNTGANLITLIEQRLDNVVFRMGFATTRANARQFTTHGHVLVDGKKVDIPSFIVKAGQKIEIKEKSFTRFIKSKSLTDRQFNKETLMKMRTLLLNGLQKTDKKSIYYKRVKLIHAELFENGLSPVLFR